VGFARWRRRLGLGADVPDGARGSRLARDVRHPRLEAARERWPALPLLVLTVYDDDERIFSVVRAPAAIY
jgi:hypothetical protein